MPQLLQWCTLSPQGASNLAAGTRPFKELPDVVSETEPEAFVLEIFFHVQSTGPTEQAAKRAANALVPTSLAYAGGQMDFAVDMGPEYATRLMIVKGQYDVVSLAVYGQVATDAPPVQNYEQRPLPIVEPLPLSKSIDPANSSEPKQLAEKLLSIISDSVSLPLVIRLMFCLKPSDDDWEDPDFPHLYSYLDDNEADFDLEGVVSSMRRPIQDDIPTESEAFSKLADRVLDFIGPKSNDQAYHIAKLLNISASQHPEMARTLLNNLDLLSIFDESTVDESIILSLLHACANRDIANHIARDDKLFEFFTSLQTNSKFDQYTQAAAKRLTNRIEGWQIFEDCLVNKGDFVGAVKFLKDITSEENSVGIWVSCILLNEDLYSPLTTREDDSDMLPPPLFRSPLHAVNHDEFVTFVRALVGIICVLAVWAWADSLPNDMCRERTLGVLNIWQSIEGYDNIVDYLLRLRQLTRRLGWIIADSDPPRKSGIFAERILSKLADDPDTCLQDAFIDTSLNLKQPLSFITEQDRLALRKNALVAEDGLAAAVEELLYTSERPYSLRRLRTLRVSMAIIQREIEDEEREWRVLNKFWEGDAHGVLARLVDLLSDISGDVSKHFALSNVSRVDHVQVALLFNTANELLRLIEVMLDGYPLTSLSLRVFAIAVADLFVCCDSADGSFAQTSPACAAAQAARQACLDVTHVLTGPAAFTETGALNAQVVLRTMLAHASCYAEHEPVHHFLQVYSLIDHLLPYPDDDDQESEPSHWVSSVLPKSLLELKQFFKLLDADSRLHMFCRLIRMDNGTIGVGEWLLTEELKSTMQVLHTLERPQLPDNYRLVLQHQLSASLSFLLDIVKPDSTLSDWHRDALAANQDLVHLQITVLMTVLDGCYTSPSLTQLVHALGNKADGFDPDLRFVILLHLLRVTQVDPTIPGALDSFSPILQNLPPESIDSERLRVQFGLALSSFAEHPTSIEAETARVLRQTFEWALQQGDKRLSTLQGLKAEEFHSICDVLANLDPEADISNIRSAITIDEDEVFPPSPIELPPERQIQLSLDAIEGLINPRDSEEDSMAPRPSTPRAGNKTPDILGTIISPPTALLRSPAATGLTKTYANNDFRQLRQAPSARLNTSRLPSTHVDDFESAAGGSPTNSVTSMNVNVTMMGPPTTLLQPALDVGNVVAPGAIQMVQGAAMGMVPAPFVTMRLGSPSTSTLPFNNQGM